MTDVFIEGIMGNCKVYLCLMRYDVIFTNGKLDVIPRHDFFFDTFDENHELKKAYVPLEEMKEKYPEHEKLFLAMINRWRNKILWWEGLSYRGGDK